MDEVILKKKEIRKEMARRKCALSSEAAWTASVLAYHTIEQWEAFQNAEVILLYHALPDEFPTDLWLENLFQTKEILLPVVRGTHLELCRYQGKELLCQGCYSISEPVGAFFTEYDQINLCFIPGMAFDRKGNRLGRGKGYYDRLLERIPAPRIGVSYECQVLDAIPSEPHDVRMDYLLTEKTFLSF